MRIPRFIEYLARCTGFLGIAILVVATLLGAGFVVMRVVAPGYVNPVNRTYTSRLGYAAVLRMENKPFPVTLAHVEEKTITGRYLGEGLVCAELVQVPLVPMGRITRVYVKPGDCVRQGQLLAELDTRLAELQITATKTAIAAATVTLERTKIGSPVVMPKERPDIDEVTLKVARKEAALAKELVDVYQKLVDQGAQSLDVLLAAKKNLNKAIGDVETAELDLKMSQPGRPLSIRAAELAVEEAQLTLAREMRELKDYKVYANGDGIVEQVMIHEGEYKPGAGTPAFVLAVGRWFGAYLDQTAIGRFEEGTPVDVRLEAFPGRTFPGRVEKIIPIVTYSQGGPEAKQPIRPLGTGSPEWPATFSARIALEGDLRNIVPGLTGFADVRVSHKAVAVPRASLTSVSAGKAVAFVVHGDTFRTQEVVTGLESDNWVEIQSGLTPGMEIIAEGHEVLRPGDRIAAAAAVEEHRAVTPTEVSAREVVGPSRATNR